MNSNSPSPAPPAPLGRIVLIIAVLAVIGLLVGFVPRWSARRNLVRAEQADAVITVDTVLPTLSQPVLGTPLPAEVKPFMEAAIHARASGYLRSWLVDIGTTVTNGQVLAEIDTPELNQQLAQARAELDQAQASLTLAQTTATRWTELLKTASVSEQETAEKTADLALKQANVAAAKANVQRLTDLENFGRVTAPFAGTITARSTDIGQLIAADSGPELFHLAQTDPLRVYVRVPQQYIHAIAPQQKAELMFQELPGRIFSATVMRTAGAVDASSRTLLVELQVPNPKGEIFAGSFAQMRFTETAPERQLTITDNALIFRAQGLQVALVDSNNVVQLRAIKLGRDFGTGVEVVSGLSATDRIIVNPPDSIADGMSVHVAPPSQPTK